MGLPIVVRDVIRKRDEVKFEMKEKFPMEAKLMECFTKFDLGDFIGFARLVKVDNELIKEVFCFAAIGDVNKKEGEEERDVMGDFICEIVSKYSELGRKTRRVLLKKAEAIAKENAEKNRQNEDSTT